MSDDRRESERLSILGQLEGGVMVFQPMTVTELSARGMQIETATQMQLDSLHDFRLPLDDRPIIVKGRVVHCRISDVDQEGVRYRTGVEFLDMPDHARTALDTFLDKLRVTRT